MINIVIFYIIIIYVFIFWDKINSLYYLLFIFYFDRWDVLYNLLYMINVFINWYIIFGINKN